MANPFDQFDAPKSNPFDQFDAPPKASGAIRRLVADKALGFASGAVGATKAIADAAGAGNAVSTAMEQANAGINDYLSPEAKADQQEQAAIMAGSTGKGAWEGIKAGARAFSVAPVQTAMQGLGSVAPIVAGSALTGGALPAAAVGAGLGVAMGAGTAKGAIFDDIKKRSLAAGMTDADATAAATQAQEYGGDNTDQIALGGALGAADALTGVSAVAGKLARGALGKPVAAGIAEGSRRGVVGRALTGMAGEIPLEAAQGGQEQIAANLAAQRAGFEAGTFDNVASNATLEALASAGPGAAFGVANKAPAATPEPAAPTLQIGNTPDPYLSFPDGTVARRSEVEAYVNSLPADQQPAARAKMMGLAEQPGTPEPAPPAGPTPQLGYSPLAGTPTVFPDGSVALNGEQEFARRYAPQKPSEAMGLDPAVGPLSAAAVTAVDTGAHQEIQLQQANEADQAAYEQATAEQAKQAAELDTATKPITHGPIAEAAMSDEDKRAVLFSNQAVADGGKRYAGTLDGDILNGLGKPYPNRLAAARRANMEGKDWTIAQVQDGFVARRKDANGPSTDVLPVPASNPGQRGVEPGASVASALGTGDVAGSAVDAGRAGAQSSGGPASPVGRGNAAPVATTRTQPTTLGTQTTATAGPGFTAKDVTRVQNAPPRTNTTPAAPAVEAPAVVAGDATTAKGLPAAGSAAVEAAGVDQAAHAAATSPLNDLPQPTDAQKEAGNYKKGHLNLHGLDISIENPRGSTRSGKRPDGSTWSHDMSDHYGYVKRTVGADSEQVDVYIGPKPDSTKVFVVDQLDQQSGGFDEHKALLGYANQMQAIRAYRSNFDKGWKVGPVKAMSVDEFKAWIKSGDTTKPVSQPQEQTSEKAPKAVEATAQQQAPGPVPATAKPAASDGVAATSEAKPAAAPVAKPGLERMRAERDAKKTKSNALKQKVEQARAVAVKPSKFTAPFKGARNEAERALLALSHKDERDGDVLMGNLSFAPFDAVVALVREGIASGDISPFPAQLHFKLDMAMRDVDRVLKAATAEPPKSASEAAETASPEASRETLAEPENPADQGVAMFSRADGYSDAVDSAIAAAVRGEDPGRGHVSVGNPSAALIAAGVADQPLRTSGAILAKAHFDHGVTKAMLKAIPDLIDAPTMVFKSDTVPGSYVVITKEWVGGKPLMVAIKPTQDLQGKGFNFVPSAYPRSQVQSIQGWIDKGLLTYIDTKQSPQWFDSAGLQLPRDLRTTKGLQARNIASEGDIVKESRAPYGTPSTVAEVQKAIRQLIGITGRNQLGRIVATTSAEIKSTWEPLTGQSVNIESEGDAGRAQGYYDPKTKTVFLIADHIRAGDETAVLAHELMHKHGQAVLGKEGWDRLHGVISTWEKADPGSEEYAVYRYARNKVEAVGAALSNQELFPYAVEAAMKMGIKPNALKPAGTVANWLASVKHMLADVWAKVTGKPETFKAQDLVNLAFGIAQRENPENASISLEAGAEPTSGGAFSRKVDQTQTEAFRKWFGDSKVVDADGKPLVVYHGTNKTEQGEAFTMFDAYGSNYGLFGQGAYFTEKPDVASSYTSKGRGDAPSVYPAYLSIKNPMNMDKPVRQKELEAWQKSFPEVDFSNTSYEPPMEKRPNGLNNEDFYRIVEEHLMDEQVERYEGAQIMQEGLRSMGHDGITHVGGGRVKSEGVRHQVYIAFDPEQVKSATGNNGDFDGTNPDIRFSRSQIVGQTSRQHTPEQLRAMANVGFQVEVPTLKERAQALWKDAGKKMAQGIVDQFAPVKSLDKEAYGLLRLAKGASGAFEAFLRGGRLKLTDGVYDFDDANKGGVVDKLLIPLHGEHHDFMRWVAANRAERLQGEGKENLFSPQDITDLKTLASGTTDFDYTIQTGPGAGRVTRDRTLIYADANRVFNEFNTNVLDLAEQSGLIDGASRKVWEHEFYVPFYRVADEDTGGVRGMSVKGSVLRQQAFKELKGGKNALNADLLDNTLMNWAHLLDASAKNRAAKATIEAAERMGIATGGNQSTLASMGASIHNKAGVVWFMDGGQKRYSLIDNTGDGPYLMTAINALEYAGMRNPVMNAMGTMKHVLTVGVTASPFFKVRNLIRDSVQVIGTSGINVNPAANIGQGWKLTDPKSDAYFRLLAGGGTIHFGTMLEGSEAKRVQALVESGVDDASILNSDHKVKAFYRKFIEPGVTAYNELGNRGEAINRAALYDQLRKQGVNHADASLQARDLMDFSMQGSFTSIRFLTQVVPFFNARIQGLYKLGRAAKEDPARFSAVVGAAAVVSLSLLAMFGDDDDWKKREEWDRNNFWWFKFGGMAFRIPKPFEIGAISTLAERGFELAFDKEMTGERFRKQVLTLLGDNLSMNPVPQLVKPIMDVYANKDSFSGRPIETMGMDKLKSDYRFTDRTSMTARGLSTAANAVTGLVGAEALSPVQIDHMLRGYFGWLGSFIVATGDKLARPAMDQPGRATPDYWKTATGGMVSDLRDAPSRYVSKMYEQAKELEQAYGTWRSLQKEGKAAEAQEFAQDNRDKLARYRRVEGVKRAEAKFNQRIRMIERGNMDSDAKRDLIRTIQTQKDQIARQVAD